MDATEMGDTPASRKFSARWMDIQGLQARKVLCEESRKVGPMREIAQLSGI
jgi:hypothetical protein